MEGSQLTEQLKALATECGFDDSGVCEARTWPEMLRLDEWLAKGDDAGMWYMGKRRDLRVDPRFFFPPAQRAFMVVKAYGPWAPEERTGEGQVTISRHAVGEDYHVSVRRMLQPLKRAIGAAGYRFRAFTDAAPVMEKVLAVRSGLGVMGRNTLLTHPHFGSWVLIGGIVTDAPLVCDTPVPDPGHCQSCDRCVQSCPGGALRMDGSLDARKCISYWTTEADVAELPAAVAEVLEGRAFGCDRCQEVCPMNDGLPAPLLPVPAGHTYPIGELLSLDADRFEELFGGTTMRRLGLEHFLRNVRAIANPSAIRDS